MSDHHLFRLLGEIKRGVARLTERTDTLMVDEQEVQVALEGLKNDLASKLGEIDDEVTAIENNISAGAPADLSALKGLVGDLDTTVTGFTLPSTTAGSTTTPPSKPLYKHVGEGIIDTSQWTAASVVAEDGSELFEFAGDTAGALPTGASAEWEVYTGTTRAAGPTGV